MLATVPLTIFLYFRFMAKNNKSVTLRCYDGGAKHIEIILFASAGGSLKNKVSPIFSRFSNRIYAIKIYI